jgi:hypothetical protein
MQATYALQYLPVITDATDAFVMKHLAIQKCGKRRGYDVDSQMIMGLGYGWTTGI